MININNKSWNKLRVNDIERVLLGTEDENFYFEFKADDEAPAKLIKEISAFANTYGGYIFLGINDDKTIGGCNKWNEQRIHTTIHDSITPIPNFDVKRFVKDRKNIFVIKIEEGTLPPYVTNKGQIYERVSSGSFPINQSSKLTQLYQKRRDQLNQIKEKIEIAQIDASNLPANNLFGYIDFGFSVTCSERNFLQNNFYDMDLSTITNYIKSQIEEFSISQVGHSYLFSLGDLISKNYKGEKIPSAAGINNYIEIMADGSAKGRIVLTGDSNNINVDITKLVYFYDIFKGIYAKLFGNAFSKIFVHAHKFEKLTVIKQFIPYYKLGTHDTEEDRLYYKNLLIKHRNKYGNNLIIESNRLPQNNYTLIDRKYFSDYNIKYDTDNLITLLFESGYITLGYIDILNKFETDNE